MVFKVNYNHQRAERTRLKQAKKDAKLREKEEAAARRKSEPGSDESVDGDPGSETEPNGGPSAPPVAAAGE